MALLATTALHTPCFQVISRQCTTARPHPFSVGYVRKQEILTLVRQKNNSEIIV